MHLSRRSFLAGAILPFLSGCSPSGSRRVVFLGEDVPGVHAIKDVATGVAREWPVEFIIDPYEQMVMKANTDFASRSGNYDVVLQYNAALANYVRNNFTIPLSEFPDQDWVGGLAQHLFPRSWKEIGWYQSSTQTAPQPFGVPFSANSMLLCCNRALFESAEQSKRFQRQHKRELRPPKTWDEFETIAQFFTSADTRGIALQGAELWIYYEWANLAFGLGGGVMRKAFGWESDANTPLILAAPETVRATELYLRLKRYSQFGQSNADFFATDAGAQVQLMRTGRYAMAILWSDVAYNLVHAQQSWSDAFTFHTIPGSVSMLAGGSYYINRQTKSLDRAIEIIKRLFEREQQTKLARLGLCPPLRDIYTDGALAHEIPYLSALGASLERGVYMLEAGPDADDIMQIISRVLQELFRAEQRPDVASRLATAQEEIAQARTKILEFMKQRQSSAP